MKKSNKNSKVSKLKLNKLSIVRLDTMNMIKGGNEGVFDISIHDDTIIDTTFNNLCNSSPNGSDL